MMEKESHFLYSCDHYKVVALWLYENWFYAVFRLEENRFVLRNAVACFLKKCEAMRECFYLEKLNYGGASI